MAKALAYFMTVGMILLFLLTILSLALPVLISQVSSISSPIVVNRTHQSDSHIYTRHGMTGLAALLIVRQCPTPVAYFCPSNFQRPPAVVLGCPLERDRRCAICVINAVNGHLLTCYMRRNCQMSSCEPIPPPPVKFPVVCGIDQQTECISEDEFLQGNLYICGLVGVPCDETEK